MKRMLAVLLCTSLVLGLLTGCSMGKKVQAGELPKNEVIKSKPAAVQTSANGTSEAVKAGEEPQVQAAADIKADLTMSSIVGLESDIVYNSVKGLMPEEGTHIAVVVKNKKSSYWSAVKSGMETAIKELNESLGYKGDSKIRMTFEGPADENDVEAQINTIDAVLSENPSVLCLAAIDMNSCQAQLETAMENGIPVVVLDSGVTSDMIQSICATDNYQAGVDAAKRLSESIGDNGKIAILAHNKSSETSKDRERGFRDEITGNHPKITIVETSEENADEPIGSMIQDVLDHNPDLAGYFCTNEKMSASVLDQLKKNSDRKIAVVGFDSGKTQVSALKNGEEVGIIAQNPYGMGYATIVAAARAELGLMNASYIDPGYQWIDKNNINDKLYSNYLYE